MDPQEAIEFLMDHYENPRNNGSSVCRGNQDG